ncbi:MAG: dehydrogenase [Clostridia bacterium]|nr:dehydrogenase [Clostridia bacterium]
MPTNMYNDPGEALTPGSIRFRDIPVCRYSLTVEHEKQIYTSREFVRIYRDMAMVREFETMLSLLKEKGVYNDVSCPLHAPVRLAIGEEAAAVGEAYCMGPKDVVFGSERSLGFTVAKGLSAIERMTENELITVMKKHLDGETLAPVADLAGRNIAVKDLAIDFLLYGLLSEILGKRTGFNRGMAGPTHAFFTPFGIYPNNAIPAASAGLAVGAALYKKNTDESGFVAVNLDGDACACGATWEAVRTASLQTLRAAREGGKRDGLALLFTVLTGRTLADASPLDETALRLGASSDGLYAERVNGNDPMAVIDAVARKKERIEREGGPALLELVTYRAPGHAADCMYDEQIKRELEAWRATEPLRCYRDKLIRAGIAGESELGSIDVGISRRMTQICRLAADDTVSPYLTDAEQEALAYAGAESAPATGRPETCIDVNECSRVAKIAAKARMGYDDSGKPIAKNKRYNVKDAIFEPILQRFYEDAAFFVCGNQASDVTESLSEAVPAYRFADVPTRMGTLVSVAAGYAMCGGRAVVELSHADLIARAGDEILNQLAKWRGISGGMLRMPVLLRVPVGAGQGAQLSQDLSSLVASMVGLHVIYPVTPYDMRGMLTTALRSDDPVIVFESQRVYAMGECFHEGGVTRTAYDIPLGEADVKREGDDLTVLTLGPALYRAIEAAELLEEKYGVSAEVIDARSLVPFDYETVMRSVSKTGRIVIVGDSAERGSLMRDIASNIGDFCFDELDAPPVVVGAKNRVIPTCEIAKAHFPDVTMILDAIHQKILPLKDYTPRDNFSTEERIRRAKRGL